MDPWSRMVVSAVDAVAPAVVSVTSVDPKETQVAIGSGFFVDGQHVLTQSRIYSPGDRLAVALADGQRFEAELTASDPLYLLALLRVRGEVAIKPPLALPPDELRPGLLVLALGNPLHADFGVNLGVLSAVNRTIYRPERLPVDGLCLTDAAIHAENIGGPLISLEGRLVGLNGWPGRDGLNLCIQAPVVRRLVDQMLQYGRASHPWLGFSGQPEIVSHTLASLLEIPVRRGVSVTDVVPGGPGDRAGVRPFDLVVGIDGTAVDTLGAVRRALAERRTGETGTLTVLRGSALQEMVIPVEEMPRLSSTPWSEGQG